MGTGAPAPYTVRRVDPAAERDTLAALMAAGFPSLRTEAIARKIDAQYVHNPAGLACTLVLDTARDAMPAGMQCLVRRRMHTDADPVAAAIMADYCVRPEHRALGPALQLLKEAVAAGRAEGWLLYGFPNEKATLIFRRAGFTTATELTRYGQPLRAGYLLAGRMRRWPAPARALAAGAGTLALAAWRAGRRLRAPRLRWSDHDEVPDTVDAVWSALDRRGLVVGDRSARFLRWRYPAALGHRVSVARDATGAPCGYVVWSAARGTLHIHDVLATEPARGLAALLDGFLGHVPRRGLDSVSLECCGPPEVRAALERAGFRPREAHPVYAIAPDGRDDGIGARLYLTSFDRDSD